MTIIDTNIASGANADVNLNSILTVPSGYGVIVYNVIFTNTTSNIVTVSVYVYDGVADRLYETIKIPAGSGKALEIKKLRGLTLEGNQVVKIQATSADSFNYKINGAQRS